MNYIYKKIDGNSSCNFNILRYAQILAKVIKLSYTIAQIDCAHRRIHVRGLKTTKLLRGKLKKRQIDLLAEHYICKLIFHAGARFVCEWITFIYSDVNLRRTNVARWSTRCVWMKLELTVIKYGLQNPFKIASREIAEGSHSSANVKQTRRPPRSLNIFSSFCSAKERATLRLSFTINELQSSTRRS